MSSSHSSCQRMSSARLLRSQQTQLRPRAIPEPFPKHSRAIPDHIPDHIPELLPIVFLEARVRKEEKENQRLPPSFFPQTPERLRFLVRECGRECGREWVGNRSGMSRECVCQRDHSLTHSLAHSLTHSFISYCKTPLPGQRGDLARGNPWG